jgi:aminoglycoside phosphotransferase (APT) family kinase protein
MSALGDVDAWLAHRADRLGGSDVTVESVEQFSRGVSRETWGIDVIVDGEPRGIVVRRDHEIGSVDPVPLRFEYEVYRRLHAGNLPVAEPLWFEDDPSWTGREAYVRRRVDGHWRLPFLRDPDPAFNEQKIAASKAHLAALARVHTCDWEALGFGDILDVPDGPEDCARNLIRHFERRIAEIAFEPNAALAEGLAWMKANAPTDSPGVFLCKGTNGHGEEIWSDGNLVALSDWELASLGDPANDIAQCQEMIPKIVHGGEQVWGMDQALAFYEERSGIPIAKDRVWFYRRMYGLPQFMFTHHAAGLVVNGGNRLARFAWTSTEMQYWAELALGNAAGFAPRKAG